MDATYTQKGVSTYTKRGQLRYNELYFDLTQKKFFFRKKTSCAFIEIKNSKEIVDSCYLFNSEQVMKIKKILDGRHVDKCHYGIYSKFYVTFYFNSTIGNPDTGYLKFSTYEVGEFESPVTNKNCLVLKKLLEERNRLDKLLKKTGKNSYSF